MRRQRVSFAKLCKLNKDGITKKNFELKNMTTFKIGGKAKFYLEIPSIENLLKVLFYIEGKIDYFILGNGSNLLVSDNGYSGVVIKLGGAFREILVKDNEIEAAAGASLGSVIALAKKNGLGGIEKAIGIPATIGGAVYMNAGAYGFEMSAVVDYVVAYFNGKIRYFSNESCEFGYRRSIFSTDNYIILKVGLKLEFADKVSIEKNIEEVLSKRKSSQPLEYPSAGSVFRRIDGVVVSKLLDEMSVKGMTIGGAMVSDKHSNFIINTGTATAKDVYLLIDKIKKLFKSKYDLELNTEIKLLGEIDEING